MVVGRGKAAELKGILVPAARVGRGVGRRDPFYEAAHFGAHEPERCREGDVYLAVVSDDCPMVE